MDTLFTAPDSESKHETSKPTTLDKTSAPPLSEYIHKFLATHEQQKRDTHAHDGNTIRVSEVLGTIARLYERIRNTIEYKGDQVLRRNAIERILKRLLWERSSSDTERLGQILIRELIWARYIPNDSLPKSKIGAVAKTINKYLYFLDLMSQKGGALSRDQLRTWVWGVASCEIEEIIDPNRREPYVELMNQWFTTHYQWKDTATAEHEKQIQIYLAIHRAFTKSDEHIMRYHLLLKEFPDWKKAETLEVERLSERFFGLYEEIEKHLMFKDRFALYRFMQKQVAPFEILRDFMEKEGTKEQQIINDIEKFELKIREICQIRYNQIQRKIRRGIIRSIIYIFITKVVFAMLIEIPYELYRFGHLTPIPLAINALVPPFMMFLIGLTIQTPDEANTRRILSRLRSIVYKLENTQPNSFSLNKVKRGGILSNLFALIYAALFILVFGGITYLLFQLQFTVVGIVIFFVFLSLVLLFGFRVRFTAGELKVMGERENIFSYVFNNLTLPFLSTGVYLSKGLAKINIFTVILDILIEAPLKTVIEVVEEWTSFVREKREEVVEVPE